MFRPLFFLLLTGVFFRAQAQTGNVGVGTSDPAARLDIAGDVALREGAPIAVSGNNPAVVVTLNPTQAENSFYRVTGSPTGTMTLSSIANGVDGQLIRVVNTTSINLSVTNNNAANGILTPGAAAQTIPTNGNVTLQYSAQTQRWYVANTVVTSAGNDWTKATTTGTQAVKTDNQYITGNAGIGDFSTIDPVAPLHIYNGGGARLTSASVGTVVAAFDGGSGTVNSRVIIGSNWTGTGTRPESRLEFWNNAFGGGQANSAMVSTVSLQGSAAGQVYGNLVFSTANNATSAAERMRIESDGDVGIGTTVPYAKLDVLGNIYTSFHGNNNQHDPSEQGSRFIGNKSGNTSDGFAGMEIEIGNYGSTNNASGSKIHFNTWGNSISTSRRVMTVSSNGNVGIGTTAPNANLEIYKQDGKIRISDTRADGGTAFGELGLEFTHHNTAVTKTAIIAKGIYSWKRADLHFILDDGADDNSYITGTDTRMIIKNNGNVGIGTTAPHAPLQFANTTVNRKIVMWETANNDHQYYGLGINNGTLRYQVDNPTGQHKFFCGTSATTSRQLAAFAGDGNLYLGDPNATATYDVWILPARPIGGSNATYARLGSATNLFQDVYANNAYIPGRVHIGGTNSSDFPLYVEGTSVSTSVSSPRGSYWNTSYNANQGTYGPNTDISAKFIGRVWATTSFEVSSDERIKHIIGKSDPEADLKTLLDIAVTDYTMKDSIAEGNRKYKKVIAQQVAAVYPNVVTYTKDFVPDIFRLFPVTYENEMATVTCDTNPGLNTGDRVRIIHFDNSRSEVVVTACSGNSFSFEAPENMDRNNGEIFVYGREVNDKALVDYDGLTALNISATQELYRRIKMLEEENTKLKEIVSTKTEVEQLKIQLEGLKNLILNSATSSSGK